MVEVLAKLYTYGAEKHFENSWKSVNVVRFRDALGRHIAAGKDEIDEESGFPHSWHIMWNCLTIYILESF